VCNPRAQRSYGGDEAASYGSSKRTYLVWLLVLVVLAGCGPGRPQPPLESYGALPRVALHDSVVTVPFTILIDGVRSGIERSPFMATTATSGWTKLNCRGPNPLGISSRLCPAYLSLGQLYGGVDEYRYRIAPSRSSLTLMPGSGKSDEALLFIDVSLGYYIELRGREVTRSCGDPAHDVNPATGKNDYLHFHLRETMRVRVAPDFGLKVAFTHALSPDAPCRVRVLLTMERDITGSIKGLENKTIARGEIALEAKSQSLSRRFQTAVKSAWTRIQRPYPVPAQFDEYLHLHPKALALLPIVTSGRGNRLLIKSGLQIVVSSEITSDASTTALVPLPRLIAPSEARNPHRVVAEATLRYAYVSELLRKRLIGRRFRYRLLLPVTVTNVTVFPVSDEGRPKLAVRFDYRGFFRGSLYAWGMPVYDEATERISVPDLEFTPGTNGLLSRLVRPMFRKPKFLRTLRNRANFEVSEQISKLNAAAVGTYVGNVGNGVSVIGHLHHVRVRAISLTRDGITAQIEFEGDISAKAALEMETLFR
jgi:hypothetical protein